MSSAAARPRVAVVYDTGSASPLEIVQHIGRAADLVFVLAPSEHVSQLSSVLRSFAPVVEWIDADQCAAALTAAGGCDGIVTFSDRQLRETAELAARLGLRFHSPSTAHLLTDKTAQRDAYASAGLPGPRFRRVSAVEEWGAAVAAVGVPAVLKPTRGEGSIDTYLVDDAGTGHILLRRLFHEGRHRSFQLEELLVGSDAGAFGDYVSVESLIVDGTIEHIAVTGKFALVPPFREPGQFWPAPIDDAAADAVLAMTSAALRALDVREGLTHTELKLTPSGPRLIEVNGRLGGFVNDLALRCLGRDLLVESALAACRQARSAGPVAAPGMHFQFSSLAPADAVAVADVTGLDAVRELAGISSYRLMVPCPGPLSAGVATSELDLLCGSAADSRSMFALIRQAQHLLQFQLRSADGQLRWLSGVDLPSAAAVAGVPG